MMVDPIASVVVLGIVVMLAYFFGYWVGIKSPRE